MERFHPTQGKPAKSPRINNENPDQPFVGINADNVWKKTRGDFRFTTFAKEIASNHFPENIEMKVFLPKGVSKEEIHLLINKTLEMAKTKPQIQHSLRSRVSEKKTAPDPCSKRERLLQSIKSLLKDTTFLKLNQLDLDHESKEVGEAAPKAKVNLSPAASQFYEVICNTFNDDSNLMEFCEGTKDLNVAFQQFIMNISQPAMTILREMAIREFNALIFNKHGNYLIQRIVQRDRQFSNFVTKACIENFRAFAADEYSSRVMQMLIKERADFRSFVHKYFEMDISYGYSKITVTFLLLIAMRHSPDSSEYAYVHREMEKDHSLYEFKLYKRILISYFQFAKAAMVCDTWKLIMETQSFESFFDKKFSSLILLMVVRRGFDPAIRDICSQISRKMVSLIKRKYFKVVVEKLLQPKYKSCRAAMNQSLSAISIRDLATLQKDSIENFNFYLYVTIASFKESDTDQLEAYLKRIKHFIPVETSDF